MKTPRYIGLLLMVASMSMASCSSSAIDTDNIVFLDSNIVQSSYGGLGVEWGVYEDTDKLSPESFEMVYKTIKKLNPARVRCMINFDWFVENFDDKGDADKTNDTWDYNFSNKWGNNLDDLLTYCQENGIEVALGSWNVVGSLTNDVWNMMDECTSDIRWAKISASVMDYLINGKGYSCIRWFVDSNEPNYLGVKGSSKNYNNTYAKWEQGLKNVRAAFDAKGLSNLGIVGGDTTGLVGTETYWTGIATNAADQVADYGTHYYPSNYYIDGGLVLDDYNAISKKIKAIDPGYGTTRPINMWECGLLDGKDAATDSNKLIKTVSYGVRMADFTIQTALAGINGVCFWDFDDAMNFVYSASTATPKRWGMFSSLSSDQAYDQELRPWFHSSELLTNLMRPRSKIYSTLANDSTLDSTFRCLGIVNENSTSGGFIAVNRGISTVTKSFVFDSEINGSGKLYVYSFGEGTIRLGSDGYIIPNYTIDGSLNKTLSVSIPANSLIVVSSEAL